MEKLQNRMDKRTYSRSPNHKKYVKVLSCLSIPNLEYPKISQTDASELGYGGVLLQTHHSLGDQLVRYTTGTWNPTQQNYSTVKRKY